MRLRSNAAHAQSTLSGEAEGDALVCGDAELRGGAVVIDLTEIEKEGANFPAQPSLGCMATTIGCPPGADRTRSLLAEIAGGRRGVKLRAQVLRAKPNATPDEVEEAFQEACLKAATRCRGQTMGEVYKWLHKVTDSSVDDTRDRRKHEVLVDPSAGDFEAVDTALAPPDELLIKRDERAEMDRLTLAILDRLPQRERDVAVLHGQGLARKEIAGHLSLTPRFVKRSIEDLLAAGRAQLTQLVGYGCPEGHELVARYAFGLAVGPDARRAQLHLVSCTRCGAMYEGLDLWRERVAALTPLPPVAATHVHVIERVVHAGTDLVAAGPRASQGPAGVRRHVAGVLGHLRDQAAAAYYRTVDPTPFAGVRPGAVAATVAGCLAIGGGANYCVQQGADPITVLARIGGATEHRKIEKPRLHRARASQPPAPPVVTPTITAPVQPVQSTPAPTPTTTTTAAPPPAPQDEFEPTSAGVGSQTSAATRAPKSKQPASAPPDGPGEFGGP